MEVTGVKASSTDIPSAVCTHWHTQQKIKLKQCSEVSVHTDVQVQESESLACCSFSRDGMPSKIQAFPHSLTFSQAHRPPQVVGWESAAIQEQKL